VFWNKKSTDKTCLREFGGVERVGTKAIILDVLEKPHHALHTASMHRIFQRNDTHYTRKGQARVHANPRVHIVGYGFHVPENNLGFAILPI
jgi:hypothetical protein